MRQLIPILILVAALGVTVGMAQGTCSDWVISQPGITCAGVIPAPCADPASEYGQHPLCSSSGQAPTADNLGRFFTSRQDLESCQQIIRTDGQAEDLVARTCVGNYVSAIFFDREAGRLYIGQNLDFGGSYSLLRSDGFTTSYEIFQSYDPSQNQLSFRGSSEDL